MQMFSRMQAKTTFAAYGKVRKTTAALLLTCAALLGNNACVSVSAEVQEIRHTVMPVELAFPGAGPFAGQRQTVTRVFEAIVDTDMMTYVNDAELTELSLVPADGTSSLAFLHSVKIRLLGGAGLPDVVGAEFSRERDGAMATDTKVPLLINAEFDHTDYVRSRVPFEVTMELDAPAQDWGLGVNVVFNASLEYQLKL